MFGNLIRAGVVGCAALTLATTATAATVDTIDASSGQAGTFFVPAPDQELYQPYYRWNGKDWGWRHNSIAAGFTSARLNISAWDVDEAPCGWTKCEVDEIQAFDAGSSTWVSLGTLSGGNDVFSFTDFDIYAAAGGSLIDDISYGLQVRVLIDVNNGAWAVSLGNSVITTEGTSPPNPNPGVVPLPAGVWLLLTGIGGLGVLRRRGKAA